MPDVPVTRRDGLPLCRPFMWEQGAGRHAVYGDDAWLRSMPGPRRRPRGLHRLDVDAPMVPEWIEAAVAVAVVLIILGGELWILL